VFKSKSDMVGWCEYVVLPLKPLFLPKCGQKVTVEEILTGKGLLPAFRPAGLFSAGPVMFAYPQDAP